MAVRSNYIKSLMETKNSFEKQYQEVIAESMQNIIGNNAKEEVRKLLKEAEDEDSYEEEDVVDNTNDSKDKDEEVKDTEELVDSKDKEEDDEDADVDSFDDLEDTDDSAVEAEEPVVDSEDGLWDDLESYKCEDGEYDCRGMEDGKLIKVLKAMGPEDGIRVVSNGDGTVEVEVDGDMIDGKEQFVIDLEDDEAEDECNESTVGYTDNYQKKTAMTTPDNHEPANPKTTYSMDGGVPTGVEKPYANKGDNSPYSEEVNDDTIFEVECDDNAEEINELASTTENNPAVRGTSMTHANTNSKGKKFRNSSEGGEKVKGTSENSYSPSSTNESIEFKKKMNQLYKENKEMKSIIPQLQEKLMESMVINQSMGYIVRLLNENATTFDEKKQISERFGKVNTLEEGKKLYESISEELKKSNTKANLGNVINGQLAEGKQSLVETTIYKSDKVNEALDFMKRLNSIK